ncbi:MAG: NAD(P)/FAD-dependent oxidoreductase [Pseudomonadota bacterium]
MTALAQADLPRDIAIAGCGIGGLALATLLKRAGLKPVLFDRLDAPKPVGSGLILQPVGLSVLNAMGLADDIVGRSARIDRLFGRSGADGPVVLDVRYSALAGKRYGLAVHRASLFDALYRAALADDVPIETGRTIADVDIGADGRPALVFEDGRHSTRFDLVIDALGCFSPLRSPGRMLPFGALWASLDFNDPGPFDGHALEQRYERARKMVGVLPIGSLSGQSMPMTAFFWSLKQDAYDTWRATSLNAWKAEVIALWPETEALLGQIANHDDLVMARYVHHTEPHPVKGRLVHLGDSYHATSPQLGQGANTALLDAWALATALTERTGPLDARLQVYPRLRWRHVWLYQAASHLFTPVYQSDSAVLPFIRDRIMGPLSRIPPAPQILASLVSGLLTRPVETLGLEEAYPDAFADRDAVSTHRIAAE